ncbi:DMT family transporter [Acinetobacter johnsonii]|uniref:DMT family transporter n=1 Tax=Acinetobacter johnsonii TaxID=40214 RepID=A0AAW6RVR4_ACIJO|nr:DMT family transporter [Acinetobacter johnsonii]MDG9788544.1 DMT family transporter [Acinetobacter johnsonii]MDG9800008.1 DMT family transporter [Acinetobacter johnsonii]MDH0836648.1 DMT family transporter [Acinetobacter johnsonii]MDH0838513.1 DMT family transporter [Acinetobacter johnsonii]
MSSRQALDSKASGIMFGLCILWGLQQVVLKLAAPDISAVMQIALRSGLSAFMVYPMIKLAKGTSLWGRDYLAAGILVGLLFAAEFFLVAQALRFTSAAHTVVLLYTAPIFVALGLHWKLPAERLSLIQWLGIACAFFGIVIAFLFPPAVSQAAASSALWGDVLALLAGVLWAATTIAVRLTKLAEAPATQTLFYQLFIAFLVLFPVAFFMGQATIHWSVLSLTSLLFHTVVVSFASYLIWFWLLKKYLASQLGVFSFLTPIFGMCFGVVLLNEQLELNFLVGTCFVLMGVVAVSLHHKIKQYAQAFKVALQ